MRKLPIYHLSFRTSYLLTATFLRFQEHYESPEFAGRTFSWEEFMDWYAGVKGKFSYLEDWSGFNLPDTVLAPFYAGAFDPLTRKERSLLQRFEHEKPPFYVIGTTVETESDAMLHEIVHGLYYVFPDYKEAVDACLHGHDTERLRRWLADTGYAENTMNDEINAYLLTGLGKKMNGPDVPPIRRALAEAFKARFGGPIRSPDVRRRLVAAVHSERFDPLAKHW